jgi:hypothetical protein
MRSLTVCKTKQMHFLYSICYELAASTCLEWGHATNWTVAGSIPEGVIEIFHWHDPSGRNMALGSTQSLLEMSTRNISWG